LHFHFSHAPAKQLKYIEPVVDGRVTQSTVCSAVSKQKQTKGANKTEQNNNNKQLKSGSSW